MLLAEDLLLLVTDDATGRLSAPGAQVDLGLAGAALVELALGNRVDVSTEDDEGGPGRLVVRDPSPTGDSVLDTALEAVSRRQGRKPAGALRALGKNLRPALYQRLAASGMVHAERDRVLGFISTHRWPAQDGRHKADVRRLLTEALIGEATPDPRTAGLIALLHALKVEHKAVDPGEQGLSKRQLRA